MPDPVVCLADVPITSTGLPPVAVRVSLTEVSALLRAVLPLPRWTVAAALAWVAYQQRRKTAAYRSHRKRRLRDLIALHL